MTWPLQRDCDRFYGNPRGANAGPSAKWESANLTLVKCPWVLRYAGKPVKGLRVHKKVAASLTKVLDAIWVRLGRSQAEIDRIGMSIYGGGYNFRLMRGGSSLSMHSWGCALDFDPARNGMGNSKPAMDKRVVEEFEREGWEWGGHWKDGMHFQAAWTRANPPRLKASAKVAAKPMALLAVAEEPAAMSPEPVASSPTADAIAETVQRRLDAMGYFPGVIGTPPGGMTAGAIAGFKLDRSIGNDGTIDSALLAELDKAEAQGFKRPIAVARAEATEATIAPQVEAIRQNWFSRLWAKILAIPGMIFAAAAGVWDELPEAKSYIEPVKDFVSDMPGWVWFLAVGGVGIYLWHSTRKTGAAVLKDFQEGRRL